MDKHGSAYWVDKIKLEASEKSSLKFLNALNNKLVRYIIFGQMQALTLWQSRKQASKQHL